MIRRILAMGTGGLLGLIVTGVLTYPRTPHKGTIYLGGICIVGGGWLMGLVAEKLRLVPSVESIEEKSKPMSLFSSDGTK